VPSISGLSRIDYRRLQPFMLPAATPPCGARLPISVERLEERRLLAGAAINFQPSDAPAVPGFLVDSGLAYASRGNGQTYGWTTWHGDAAHDRNLNADQLLDTHVAVKSGQRWELAVPNGQYSVKVTVGDAAAASTHNVWVEGVWTIDYQQLAANQFVTRSQTVQVNDGRLTIGAGSSPSLSTRIAAVEVVAAAPPPAILPTAKVNFQPAVTAGVGGYLVDSGGVYGARNGRTYGWTTSHTDSVYDRNRNASQLLDTNVVVKKGAQWEMAVPNGYYTVKVGVGDAASVSTDNVWVEGVQLFNYLNLQANQFASRSLTVRVTDGRLTVGIGSAASGMTRLNYIEITDSSPGDVFPGSIQWQTVAPSPIPRAEAIGAMVDNKLYVISGFDGTAEPGTRNWIAVPRGDVYDPATNQWTRIADMPSVITHTTGVVVGKTIWFVGGYAGNHPGPATTEVWKYDTVNNTWSRGPDLPAPRGAGGAVLLGNTLYYTTGMEQTRTRNMNDTWALDLDNQSAGWVSRAPIPTGRNHLGVIAHDGKLWAVGGQLGQEEYTVGLTAMEMYDPQTNTWTRKRDLPFPRSHLTAGMFIYQGRICFLGGDPAYDQPQSEVYAYDPATDSWSIMGRLPLPRSTVVGGVFADGRVISSTGNGPGATTTTWIGTPV